MDSIKSPLIVIVGPTASGKSETAVQLAKQYNGEIVSADSRQVYKGLDVGTAKVAGGWIQAPVILAKAGIHLKKSIKTEFRAKRGKTFVYQSIPHHCIDFVRPRRILTAAEFKTCAQAAIADITERGKLPIVVGGTGLWVDALVYDIKLPHVPPNARLRKSLERKTASQLFIILKHMDPARAQTIEPKNPRRLIRAIEIAKALGNVPLLTQRRPYNAIWIGICPPNDILSKTIARRACDMIRCGLLAETQKLVASGVSKKRIREFGFEYRAALDRIEKRISTKELLEYIIRDTRKYAKRQMRWFTRNSDIKWVSSPRQAFALVESLLVIPSFTQTLTSFLP